MINLNISSRERNYLYAGGAFLIIFLILQLIVFPIADKKKNLKSKIAGKTKVLTEITTLAAEFNSLKRQTEVSASSIGGRSGDFTLFSFLDRLAGESDVKKNIEYMKPSSSEDKNGLYKIYSVEMKVKDISLKQLVSYLHGVENSPENVTVKRLSIAKNKDKLNVVMEIETIGLK